MKSKFLLTVTVTLGALVWCLWQKTPAFASTAHRASATVAEDNISAALRTTRAVHTWAWTKGAALTFDFTSTTSLNLGAGADASVSVAGCWHVTVLDDGAVDDTVDLATIFTEARYLSGGQPAPHFSRMLEQVPCLLQLSRAGAIRSWEFPAWLQAADRQILTGINTPQVEYRVPDATGCWTTEEQDANGTVAVRYVVQSSGVIQKQRSAFTRVSIQGLSADSSLRIAESTFTAMPGAMWLGSFAGSERMEFLQGGKPAWSSLFSINLKARAQSDLPLALAALATCTSTAEALALLNHDLPEIIQLAGSGSVTDLENVNALRARYAGVDFAAIIEGFESTMSAAKSHADRQPAIETLRDWLLARPDEAGRLAAYLTAKALPEESSACILHALELSSSSPASQAVLATVLADLDRSHYSDAMLFQAAVAAGGVGEITAQPLMENLYRLAFTVNNPELTQIADSALMALGNLAKTNPAIRERLATELADTLQESTPGTEGYVASALMALSNGNIRNESLTASASGIFTSSLSEDLRAESLTYLHRTGDTSRTSAALQDASAIVRTRAAELLAR